MPLKTKSPSSKRFFCPHVNMESNSSKLYSLLGRPRRCRPSETARLSVTPCCYRACRTLCGPACVDESGRWNRTLHRTSCPPSCPICNCGRDTLYTSKSKPPQRLLALLSRNRQENLESVEAMSQSGPGHEELALSGRPVGVEGRRYSSCHASVGSSDAKEVRNIARLWWRYQRRARSHTAAPAGASLDQELRCQLVARRDLKSQGLSDHSAQRHTHRFPRRHSLLKNSQLKGSTSGSTCGGDQNTKA